MKVRLNVTLNSLLAVEAVKMFKGIECSESLCQRAEARKGEVKPQSEFRSPPALMNYASLNRWRKTISLVWHMGSGSHNMLMSLLSAMEIYFACGVGLSGKVIRSLVYGSITF